MTEDKRLMKWAVAHSKFPKLISSPLPKQSK